jgi:hypothetical protein
VYIMGSLWAWFLGRRQSAETKTPINARDSKTAIDYWALAEIHP